MKIADVTSFYSATGGGIRTYLREKGRRLVALGHQLHRIVPGAARSSHRTDDGVIEHTLPGPPLPFDRNYRVFANLDELGDLLHEITPDVVEVGSHYFLPWRIRELAPRRARVVGFFHSNVPETFVAPAAARLPRPLAPLAGAAHRAAWRLVRAMHDRYDATLCASRVVEHQLREHGVPRVARVGLGVDARRFVVRDRFETTSQLCYVGRLSRDKEAELLLHAAPALAAAGHSLLVAGDGPMAPRFARSKHLRYLGALSSAEVAELLRQSDACLVPGRYETFSFAAAEALACGTPVLCTDDGAAAELVHGSGCGLRFPAGDVSALVAAAAHNRGTSRAARRAAAASARDFVERELSWSAVLERILDVYRGEAPAASRPPSSQVAASSLAHAA
jgi:alpha-1,6-mannosyltransferase